MTTRFTDVVAQRVRAHGWRGAVSPAALLDQWRGFVETCEDGYVWTIYEYENERQVRDLLDGLLADPALQGFPELAVLRESVERVDERFRAACRDDAFLAGPEAPWWRRCVPRRALGDFASDLAARGIPVTPA